MWIPDGLVSYTARRPTLEKTDWMENSEDISYDGTVDTHQVAAGLGQLTDGVVSDNRTWSNGSYFGMSIDFEWLFQCCFNFGCSLFNVMSII